VKINVSCFKIKLDFDLDPPLKNGTECLKENHSKKKNNVWLLSIVASRVGEFFPVELFWH